MSFLARLADRLILQPTTQYVDPEDREQHVVTTPTGRVEVWIAKSLKPNSPSVLLLKFPGTGGRAERAGLHPANAWPHLSCRSWAINHRGYGGSDGPATIQNFTDTCDAVYAAAIDEHPDHKICVYGNSLGCISALYVAARFPVAGAYIRNPPPLAQMIATRPRYAAWNFGMSKLIANQVPHELDSIKNAAQSKCPALFIQSEQDRVIPTRYQDLVINEYQGEFRKLVLRGADHHHRAPESQLSEYNEALQWFGDKIVCGDN